MLNMLNFQTTQVIPHHVDSWQINTFFKSIILVYIKLRVKIEIALRLLVPIGVQYELLDFVSVGGPTADFSAHLYSCYN